MPPVFAQGLDILLSFWRRKVDNQFSLVGIWLKSFYELHMCFNGFM